jgi:hypothetical protein
MTQFVTRSQWGARPPRSRTLADLYQDTAHYGGPSPWGSGVDRSSPERFALTADHARCATIVRAYQAFHMDSRGWQDIAYSSLVCPHDYVYEGRGPGIRTAANGTNAGNSSSHATCYLAGEGDPLTDGAKRAFLHESARLSGLDKVHSDWKATGCPGDPLRRWVHAGHPHPGGSTPPPPDRPPVQEDDDMPARIAQVPGRREVLTVDHRYFSHVRTPGALGVLLWLGQVKPGPDGKPVPISMVQLRETYTVAPGTDDPYTIEDESDVFDLGTLVDLPDGRKVTLEQLMVEAASTGVRTELRVAGAGQVLDRIEDAVTAPTEG